MGAMLLLSNQINPYENIFSHIKSFDIDGKLIDASFFKNKIPLILFFDITNTYHKEILVYANVLYKKFNVEGLEIIGVSCHHDNKIKSFAKTGKISFPIILDNNKNIQKQIGIDDDSSGGVILFNKSGDLIFKKNYLLSKENLRQLVEKEIIGRIGFEFRIQINSLFKRGQPFPSIRLRSLRGQKINLNKSNNQSHAIMTFMSSFCSSCRSGIRIDTLKSIEAMLKKRQSDDYEIMIVFTEPFDEEDAAKITRTSDIPFNLFLSEDIFSDAEKYITYDSYKADPLTIIVNPERIIVYVEEPAANERQLFDQIIGYFQWK